MYVEREPIQEEREYKRGAGANHRKEERVYAVVGGFAMFAVTRPPSQVSIPIAATPPAAMRTSLLFAVTPPASQVSVSFAPAQQVSVRMRHAHANTTPPIATT